MNFLAVPLKSTYEVDLVKPLHAYVDSILQVNSELKTEIKEGVLELNKFRNRACLQPLDNHQFSLDLLMRYFDQLTVIENKLPITVTQNPIAFKWKDAFCKGALFFNRSSFTCSDSSFERAAVLFNIGALMSAIASSQHTRNDEELKVMTKLFQQAAGVFMKLKESTLDLIQQEPTPDLMPETLTALSALMLAQAQEAIYIKAIKDRMKPTALVKILSQCAEFYQEVQKLLIRNGTRGIWDKEWLNTVNGKAFAFTALAQYHASQVSAEAKEVGEQISRLSEAKKLLEQANNYISPAFAIEYDAIKSALTQANKDNNLIYHEKVPEFRSLPALPKAVLVKALPLTHPLSPSFHDMFESLVPVSVQNALFTFESMKADLINTKTLGMRECTLLMNGILTSLNLPAALDDVVNYARCPESIRQKSAQIRAFGGVRSIQLKLAEIQTFCQRNNETLNTITCLIDQEQSTDSHLRSKYGAKWTRISSDRITGPLYQEIAKNRELLRSASKSDSIIMSKFEHARKWIEILSKPEDELETFIPNLGGPTGSLWNSETVKKLYALMKKVDAIKSEREQLGESLKEVRCNMRDDFLRSMTSNAVLNEEKLSNEKINELYGPLQRRISDNIKEQESILAEVHIWNTKFCKEKGGDCIEREDILKELAKAYDIFFELEENLKEGIKFYNDVTQRLTRLHQKISDFCFARETEKEDMLLQFQRTSVYSSQAQSQQRQHPIYPHSTNP